MSYVINVWENPENSPLPESLEQAVSLLEQLGRLPAGQNPKFIELARCLTKRFPTPGRRSAEGELCAWSDWPITGKTESALLNLGINLGFDEDVRSFIIQEANARALCVMDEQLGEAYLPDGRVLCLPGRSPVQVDHSDADDPPKNKEALKGIYEYLAPRLREYGFKSKKRDLAFRRQFPGGWEEISIYSLGNFWPLHADVDVMVTLQIEELADLMTWVFAPDDPPGANAESWPVYGFLKNWVEGDAPFLNKERGRYQIRHRSEIELVANHLLANIRSRVLPELKKCRTVADVDGVLNYPEVRQSFFTGSINGKHHVAAAFLAKNPNLEKICRQFDPGSHGVWEFYLPRFVDYVRVHGLRDTATSQG